MATRRRMERESLIALLFLLSVVDAMAKRLLNETVFGIHGVNPSFSAREEPNQLPIPKTTGKIILKRWAVSPPCLASIVFLVDNNC